jgi:xanthine dehydrogenase accessory factor
MNWNSFIYACQSLEAQEIRYAVITIVKIDAHVPQEVGSKMIVTAEGLHSGTIGGGKLEAKGIELGKAALNHELENPSMIRIDLNKDLGMVCGGVATVFIETSTPKKWNIALYGAGHVGQALARILKDFECQIFCIDMRKEWLDKLPQASNLRSIHCANFASVPTTLPADTYHVIATQGHVFDLEVVREVLKLKHPPYIGVIGSKVKARNVRATLISEGFLESETQRFFCPMGLPFGNNTPAEIAVSISSQLLQIRDSVLQ